MDNKFAPWRASEALERIHTPQRPLGRSCGRKVINILEDLWEKKRTVDEAIGELSGCLAGICNCPA